MFALAIPSYSFTDRVLLKPDMCPEMTTDLELQGMVPLQLNQSPAHHPFFQKLQSQEVLGPDHLTSLQMMESHFYSPLATVRDQLSNHFACALRHYSWDIDDRNANQTLRNNASFTRAYLNAVALRSSRLQKAYDQLMSVSKEYQTRLSQELRDLWSWSIQKLLANSLLPWTGLGSKRIHQERISQIRGSLAEVMSGTTVLEGALTQLRKIQQSAQGLDGGLQELLSILGREAPVPSLDKGWPKDWFWRQVAVKGGTTLTRSQFETWWQNLGCRCKRFGPRQTNWIHGLLNQIYEWLNKLAWSGRS
ncbi:MAG: hypothetical protein Q9188_005008 [Gyalolechia gomerana]